MASGLAALLDDIAGIAKIAAASLDDVSAAAGKAGAKAAGVVIDDTAVTPGYAVGFTPDRELPIVAKIARGSFINKLVLLLPGALLLSQFAPWAIHPILLLGGAYLAFEATEKIAEAFIHGEHEVDGPEDLALSSEELEKQKVAGAIRTDLILSGEIMIIALGEVSRLPLLTQAVSLVLVGVGITIVVYGVVALIVKMDDIGLHLARSPRRPTQAFGKGLVRAMPPLLAGLSVVGTAAMLWVGGGIIIHALEHFHLTALTGWSEVAKHAAETVPAIGGFLGWLVFALCSAVVGLVVGGVIFGALHLIPKKKAAEH
jgi:predicted DNA repair protein MutK